MIALAPHPSLGWPPALRLKPECRYARPRVRAQGRRTGACGPGYPPTPNAAKAGLGSRGSRGCKQAPWYWPGLCGEELRTREGEGVPRPDGAVLAALSPLPWTESRRRIWRGASPTSALGQKRGLVLARGWGPAWSDSGS